MKKIYKIFLIIFAFVLIVVMSFFVYALILTKNVKLDEEKFINVDESVVFYDCDENVISKKSNDVEITPLSELPSHVKNAFIAIEDKRFYSHGGVDVKSLIRATITNVKSFSFKEGGSTITQQLIKNTHLSSDKTLKRKLSEIKLALKLEKIYSKEEILEKYLNTIYFGNNCFGITKASSFYFNKKPFELNLSESATLAGIIKSPATYSPTENKDKCLERRNLILKEMLNQNLICKEEYDNSISMEIDVCKRENGVFGYDYLLGKELDGIMDGKMRPSKKILVYTYHDPKNQRLLMQEFEKNNDFNRSLILTDVNSNVIAYISNVGEVFRQMGSTIKPLLCYAPAIDMDLLDECSIILDEKTNFNGYIPSNFLDKYYGIVSVREALSKSLNVPAVKTLNYVGIDNAKKYVSKTDIPILNEDEGLSMALGCTQKGATLSEIVSGYCCFATGGKFNGATCIKKITDEAGNIIYSKKYDDKRVFGEETASIMNYMLKDTVKNGTAKRIDGYNFDICAKTGTVGNEKGNTDAYAVSYTAKYCFGVWIGGKKDNYMDNSITGGSLPCSITDEVYKNLYKDIIPNEVFYCDSIKEIYLDKLSFDAGLVELADDLSPQRFLIKAVVKSSRINKIGKSNRFISPTVESIKTLVNINEISIKLCLTQCIEACIYRELNQQKIKVYDTKNKPKEFIDNNLFANTEYIYYVIPYYEFNGKTYYGKEIKIDKIKTPASAGVAYEDWWDNEF